MIDEKGLKETVVTTGKELISFISLAVFTGHISPENLKMLSVKYKINKDNKVRDLPADQIDPFVKDVKSVIKKSYKYLMSKYTDHGDALAYLQELIDDRKLQLDDYKQLLYYRFKVRSITALNVGQLKPFLKEIESLIKK